MSQGILRMEDTNLRAQPDLVDGAVVESACVSLKLPENISSTQPCECGVITAGKTVFMGPGNPSLMCLKCIVVDVAFEDDDIFVGDCRTGAGGDSSGRISDWCGEGVQRKEGSCQGCESGEKLHFDKVRV